MMSIGHLHVQATLHSLAAHRLYICLNWEELQVLIFLLLALAVLNYKIQMNFVIIGLRNLMIVVPYVETLDTLDVMDILGFGVTVVLVNYHL